jgi:hypothetical protein
VTADTSPEAHRALARVGPTIQVLQLFVLHGSLALGDADALSDWDLAYDADATLDPDALLAAVADRLNADRIDLVDLGRAGALLRHRVARDGVAFFEASPGRFEQFRLDAIATWCDMAPVLEPLYARVLASSNRHWPTVS